VIPFLPYSRQTLDDGDIAEVVRVLKSDYLTQGPEVAAFETELAQHVGARYAVAVSSGTAALHLAYMALDVGLGDEVLTTPNTFIATSNAALYCGATPIFADIDESSGLITSKALKNNITEKTKVIAPVDFAGAPTDMASIFSLAKKRGLHVVQDASHSLGATYRDSTVGDCQYADMTILSFHPVKPMTTGEGGAITTNDETLYKRLLQLRTHGITREGMSQNPGPWYYEMTALGYNYRMTDIQAALGRSQLRKLSGFIADRRRIAKQYDLAFKNCPFSRPLQVPKDSVSGYHLYVLVIDFDRLACDRKTVMGRLKDLGIGTQVHYIPVYQQPYYRQHYPQSELFPHTESYYSKALSIPLYPGMSDQDIGRVTAAILSLNA
jgi:UDP-4-amino-4,6-dideoxy-N-acetyl-beta-L-altrosamine transaminase